MRKTENEAFKMKNKTEIKTWGALKASGYQPKGIKTELRDNLMDALKNGKKIYS
jgi:magnesium chelatase subunit I